MLLPQLILVEWWQILIVRLLSKVSILGGRPYRLRRSFQHLGRTYDQIVHRNIAAGLQDLVPASRIAKHNGKLIVSGAFAEPKPVTVSQLPETRMISALTVNDMVDDTLVPRPTSAYVPRMRAIKTNRGQVLRKSKRDARHYFHTLSAVKK